MTFHVLDTDVLSLYQLGNEAICRRVLEHDPSELAVTIITVEEQLSSWYTLRRRVKGRAELARVYERFADNVRCLAQLQVLSFSEPAIDKYEELSRLKLGVKGNDLRIASIALCHSAVLVTRNRRDFLRIPQLRIEMRTRPDPDVPEEPAPQKSVGNGESTPGATMRSFHHAPST